MKMSRTTLRWAKLEVLNGFKNPAIVHGRVAVDVEKKCE